MNDQVTASIRPRPASTRFASAARRWLQARQADLLPVAARVGPWPVASRLMRLGLFWHFLDIIWVVIFSVVYLPGVL